MVMDVSRRSFLGGILALTAVAVAPKVMAEPLPRIVGDGVHDDTAGLQALFDGRPFTADPRYGVQWVEVEDALRLTGGHFRLTNTLRIVDREYYIIDGGLFDHWGEGNLLELVGCKNGLIKNCTFQVRNSLNRGSAISVDPDDRGPRKMWAPDQYGGGRWFEIPPRLT
jgi:hypothetical protein